MLMQLSYSIFYETNCTQNKIGYVKREIWYALERKKDFGDFKFIIPVIIEECNTLKKLDHIHSIDISREEEKEFQKLVVEIKRDWERRKW